MRVQILSLTLALAMSFTSYACIDMNGEQMSSNGMLMDNCSPIIQEDVEDEVLKRTVMKDYSKVGWEQDSTIIGPHRVIRHMTSAIDLHNWFAGLGFKKVEAVKHLHDYRVPGYETDDLTIPRSDSEYCDVDEEIVFLSTNMDELNALGIQEFDTWLYEMVKNNVDAFDADECRYDVNGTEWYMYVTCTERFDDVGYFHNSLAAYRRKNDGDFEIIIIKQKDRAIYTPDIIDGVRLENYHSALESFECVASTIERNNGLEVIQ